MEGTVIKSTGLWYDVKSPKGIIKCRLKGKLRLDELKTTNPIAVGDIVILTEDTSNESYSIEEIKKRKNYIIRSDPHKKAFTQVIASNIDLAMIVVCLHSPRTSTGFIDRILIICEAYHINPLIVLNKCDLNLNPKWHEKEIAFLRHFENTNYPILKTSLTLNQGLDELQNQLKNKVTLLCGHSGVGKSSLINALYPHVNLRVGEISNFSGKGMHTTTFAEWFDLDSTTAIIDTPGVKEFGLIDIEKNELAGYLPEFRAYLNRCQYHNCSHRFEPQCAIVEAVKTMQVNLSRYQGYISMLQELEGGLKSWQKK